MMDKHNIEMINGVSVDWGLFKSNAKGGNLSKSRKAYISFCELLHNKNHRLLSEYIKNSSKVLIDYGCSHELHWITPDCYKRGRGCPKCSGHCSEYAKEDFFSMLEENGHKIISEYVDSKTKVLINFNCGHQPHWIKPNSYKNGNRCPKCVGKGGQAKIDLLQILESNGHSLLSEYTNNSTKILIDFNCGHEPHWITPHAYKSGHRCSRCGGTSKKQAKEEFVKLMNNNSHILLSDYISSSTKVLIDFNCGHEPHWIEPHSYKNGHGCPKCAGLCPEQAKKDLIDLISKNGHKLLSEYINNSTKVLIDFNCGHESHWITPKSYKNGQGCPKCVGKDGQAKEDLINLIHKNNHTLLSEYINSSTKVLINFNCGHEAHWIVPSAYKNGQGCPLCKNKGESTLYELLLGMSYEIEIQKKYEDLKDKKFLSYDFYLSEYNLLIELDGDHHRVPILYTNDSMTDLERSMAELEAEIRLQDRQRKDKLKDDYAKNNNIPLLRIPYHRGKIELDKWKELILNKIKEIEVKRELIAL